MWGLAIGIYAAFKLVTWYLAGGPRFPLNRSLAYLIAWPGMNAQRFLAGSSTKELQAVPAPSWNEWLGALAKLLLGMALLFVVVDWLPADAILLRGWLGMAGIGFCLHFGMFHVLSCAWRSLGVAAEPLMHWPICASSVSDFWSYRWNTAFRDLTRQLLFRPLVPRIGPLAALWVAFFASGVVHDMVISLPARAGYGGPTLFFLVQAAGITVERSRWGRMLGLARGVRGWLFTAACLILPAPLLFHTPFLRFVVNPFLDQVAWH